MLLFNAGWYLSIAWLLYQSAISFTRCRACLFQTILRGFIGKTKLQLHVEWHFHSSWTHEFPHPTLLRKRNMAWMPLTVFCSLRCLTNSYCQSRFLSHRSSILTVVYLVDVVFHPFCFQFSFANIQFIIRFQIILQVFLRNDRKTRLLVIYSYLILLLFKFCNPFTQFLLKQGFVGKTECILLSIDVGILWQSKSLIS